MALAMFAVFWNLNSHFSGVAVAKLPFEPFGMVTWLSHRNLPGNDLQVTPETPRLARTRGSIAFSETGFSVTGAQARALGGDVRIEGGLTTQAQPLRGADMSPFSRRDFLASTAGLSAAALAAADLRIAAAQQSAGGGPQGRPAPAAQLAPGAGPAWEIGPFEDLRDYVRELERRGLLLKVRDIDQDQYEGTALMYRLVDRFGMYFAPTLHMENVKIDGIWHKGPIIINHFGHWDTECLALGLEPVPDNPFATYRKALARVDEYLRLGGTGAAFPTAPRPAMLVKHPSPAMTGL